MDKSRAGARKTDDVFLDHQNHNKQLYDLSGYPITDSRVLKYTELIKTCIILIFPKGFCMGAGMSFHCLLQEGYIHVIKSLVKFDRNEALNAVSKDPDRRKTMKDEERLAWKRANPELAVLEVEKSWVKKKLISEFRRKRWETSPGQLGGTTYLSNFSNPPDYATSEERENEDVDLNPDRYSFQPSTKKEPTALMSVEKYYAIQDIERLLDIQEIHGEDVAIEYFAQLSKDRRNNIKSHYENIENNMQEKADYAESVGANLDMSDNDFSFIPADEEDPEDSAG